MEQFTALADSTGYIPLSCRFVVWKSQGRSNQKWLKLSGSELQILTHLEVLFI